MTLLAFQRFYKDHMVEDSRRIEQLFRDASENGIPIQVCVLQERPILAQQDCT